MSTAVMSSDPRQRERLRPLERLSFVSTLAGAPWGGSEELWAAVAREAASRGLPTTAGVQRWPIVPVKLSSLVDLGVRVDFRAPDRLSLVRRLLNRVHRRPSPIARQLQHATGDLIAISLSTAFDLADDPDSCRILRDFKIPYVLIVQHNFEEPVRQAWRGPAREVFGRAALNCFVSANNLLALERQIAAAVPKAIVVQNPINLPNYSPVAWPSCDEARFACIGRLDVRFKGQDVLLHVLASERWKNRSWRLSLYGSGSDELHLRSLAAHYSIADRVRFCGHRSDVSQIWAEEQILIMPSRSEGTPLALIEAIVASRPAIVTNVGDSARWVEDGATGFTTEACNSNSIKGALEAAWESRADWQAMGERARRHFSPLIDQQPAKTLLDAILKVGSRHVS